MKKPYNAWKEGLPYYMPVIAAGVILLGLDAVVPIIILWPLGCLVLAAGFGALMFFRDPPRPCKATGSELVSPADGAIVGIEDLDASPHYDGPCKRISIFLSVLNVHVNRTPVDAKVEKIIYKEGAFKNAMKAETSECNESNAVWLDTEYGPMTVRQISGAIARRIVCPIQPGEQLARGEKFGMIKFGSRTELYLRTDAKIHVTMGQKVRAGATIIAEF